MIFNRLVEKYCAVITSDRGLYNGIMVWIIEGEQPLQHSKKGREYDIHINSVTKCLTLDNKNVYLVPEIAKSFVN